MRPESSGRFNTPYFMILLCSIMVAEISLSGVLIQHVKTKEIQAT